MGENQDRRDFSVVVLASDLGVDAQSFLQPLLPPSSISGEGGDSSEIWHDCSEEEDFSDIEALQAFRVEGSDRDGNRIFRIVGKYFPAVVVSGERLKRYINQKVSKELSEGPICILYMHTVVQKADNHPGLSILRWIYEELPSDCKERIRVVYFLHPGLRSRLAFATLGRFFLSGGLYWKIKYISRIQYLWDFIKKGEVEIPEFVHDHDQILENRPLTDYGIEPDPLRVGHVMHYPVGRFDDRWSSYG